MTKQPSMPYFDYLFGKFKDGDQNWITTYGQHLHWGYWANPEEATTSTKEFAVAADALSQLVYKGAKIDNGMKVLDAGCGFGGTVALVNNNYSAMTITGLNIDPRQLERARQLVLAKAGNKIDFVEGDACELPFKDNEFDAATAVECIFHFPSRIKFLKEAHRVLKPGGWLSISDFVPSGYLIPILGFYAAWAHKYTSRVYGDSNGATTKTLYRIMARLAGFSRVEFQDINKNTLPTYPLIQSLLSKTDPTEAEIFKANRYVEFMSKTGMLRYTLVRFQKSPLF